MAQKFTPENVTMREHMQGDIPQQYGGEIIKEIMENSVMMQLAQYKEMTKPEMEFTTYAGGIGAYWVEEGERIQTSRPQWLNVKMKAHKMAVIVPITREALQYNMPDFFNRMRPLIAEAFYRKFDQATILGVDTPFTQSLDKSAKDSGTVVTGPLNVENWDKTVDALTDHGHEPNAVISKVANTSLLRNLVRNENGLYTRLYDGTSKILDGAPVLNVSHELEEFKRGTLYTGDFDNVFYGIPYNFTYKIAEEGTISTIKDADGNDINLFEREMQALRVTADFAFLVVKDNAFGKLTAETV